MAPPKEPPKDRKDEGPSTKLVTGGVWDIRSPPPVNTVKGAMTPKVLRRGPHRKLTIEVRRTQVAPADRKKNVPHLYDECILQ